MPITFRDPPLSLPQADGAANATSADSLVSRPCKNCGQPTEHANHDLAHGCIYSPADDRLGGPMSGRLPIMLNRGLFREHPDVGSALQEAKRLAATLAADSAYAVYIPEYWIYPRERIAIEVLDESFAHYQPKPRRPGPIVLRLRNHEFQEFSDGLEEAREMARRRAVQNHNDWVVYQPILLLTIQSPSPFTGEYLREAWEDDDLPF